LCGVWPGGKPAKPVSAGQNKQIVIMPAPKGHDADAFQGKKTETQIVTCKDLLAFCT
jgi:hypothetical protein